jgi:hypothetical protein
MLFRVKLKKRLQANSYKGKRQKLPKDFIKIDRSLALKYTLGYICIKIFQRKQLMPRAKKEDVKEEPKTASANDSKSAFDGVATEWATAVINQMVEAQKMWLELVTKQNQLVFKTISEVSGMTNNAPTEALAAWAKQGMEGFIEAQKKWSEIAMAQSSQLMNAVQSGANFADPAVLGGLQATAGQGLETIVKMRMAWLDFASQQNAQIIDSMKQSLNIDDSNPAAMLANFAQSSMNSYVEVQKRWLDMAMQLPFLNNEKK